jgi:cellobiose transport system permease protein
VTVNRQPLATRFDLKVAPYLYVAPFFVIFGVFGVYPLVFTGWVAMHRWSPLGGSEGFVGLQNFTDLIADDRFWNALVNTFSIWLLSTVPQLLFALVLATVLNDRLRAKGLFRMAVLIPNITSVAAVSIVFGSLFGRDYGLFNLILEGLGFDRVDWVSSRLGSHFAIASMITWRWTGYNALIYLAAMQTIPKDLLEAASIDGASKFRRFVSVTVPQLRPTIIFTVIVSTIGGMQIFTEPLLFAPQGFAGGSDRQFQTLPLLMYEQALDKQKFGYGSAVAVLSFFVIVVLVIINGLIARRIRSDD